MYRSLTAGLTMRAAFLPLLLLCPLAGCSFEPTRYALSGSVTLHGGPAPLAVLRFYPTGGANPMYGGTARTDAEGKFTLGEDGQASGLPAGDYKVTFSQTLVNGRPTLGGSGGKKSEALAGEREGLPEPY